MDGSTIPPLPTTSRAITDGKKATATLTLTNRGLNTFKKGDYKLEAFDAETGDVLGSLDGPYSVLADDTEDVDLAFKPLKAGKENIAFRIVSDIDVNASNNTSDTYNFTVAQAGASEWNVDIVEGNLRGDRVEYETRVPFDFGYLYSNFQSIYDYELIGVEGEITRMAYRYERLNDFSGATNVSIDLGTSNTVYYNSVYYNSVYYNSVYDACTGPHTAYTSATESSNGTDSVIFDPTA